MATTEQAITPRYEFRAFAQSFGIVVPKLREHGPCEAFQESEEIYLVSRTQREHNVKIRGGRFEIKQLVHRDRGLEQWKPTAKEDFPVARAVLQEVLPRTLGRTEICLPSEHDTFTWDEFMQRIVEPSELVSVATVFKRRYRYHVLGCAAEIDELLINGAAIGSVAIESEDADAVLAAREACRLEEYENVNFPRAIRCVLGLERWSSR